MNENEILAEFYHYIQSPRCPMKVKIPYHRVCQRVQSGNDMTECTSQVEVINYSEFSLEISKESADAVAIASTFAVAEDEGELLDYNYDRGLEYDWSQQHVNVSQSLIVILVKRNYHCSHLSTVEEVSIRITNLAGLCYSKHRGKLR